MLRELHISNLAVIADARIELTAGLNCFTGATGAGKSLVIGAIEILLGLRSPSEMLRPGVDEGRVSGLFEVKDAKLLARLDRLTDTDVSTHGGELLLTRRLYASGRTSVNLNGAPITLAMLKEVAAQLVDVHGQHDHQYLLRPANQLEVLDQYAGLAPLRQEYYDAFAALQAARARIVELEAGRSLRAQQLELHRFQADEIDSAELDEAEVDELSARASVLSNLEKLKKDASAAHSALYEADGSALERVKMIAGVISELSELDQTLKPIATGLRDAAMQLEDSAFDLGRYLDKLDLDPAELVEVNERLNVINRVLNKYGDPVSSTLEHRADIGEKIAKLEHATDNLAVLTKELGPLTGQLIALGNKLSTQRIVAAKKLSPLIARQFEELGMAGATFDVAVQRISDINAENASAATPGGFDVVEFIARTNPGLPPQPLRKIGSGGELSRVMLALKSVLAAGDRVSVLVFDEIDANVGGRLGAVIGGKLRELAAHHQVLCITHLPQIACYADRHLTVRKISDGKETKTTVKAMTGDERIEEIAEMIGGTKITDVTRAQARELLDAAAGAKRPRRTSKRATA